MTPLPRSRPKLAALTPFDGLGVTPEENFAKTAIYDITAHVVYMPNGDRLEAHSGLGPKMDDPHHVHVRMHGATPPNTYKLTMREKLFHGVQAIRLNPVGDGNMFGRAGILAHTYMLGPNGQSNGCVSFKDYAKFLAAFQRGEVERMVVVSRLARPPAFAKAKSHGEQVRKPDAIVRGGVKFRRGAHVRAVVAVTGHVPMRRRDDYGDQQQCEHDLDHAALP